MFSVLGKHFHCLNPPSEIGCDSCWKRAWSVPKRRLQKLIFQGRSCLPVSQLSKTLKIFWRLLAVQKNKRERGNVTWMLMLMISDDDNNNNNNNNIIIWYLYCAKYVKMIKWALHLQNLKYQTSSNRNLKRWVSRWRLKTLTQCNYYPYATLKGYVLRWRLKTSTLVMVWISWGSEFHSFGAAAIWNDLSPNVTFVIINGDASKIPLVERKLAISGGLGLRCKEGLCHL